MSDLAGSGPRAREAAPGGTPSGLRRQEGAPDDAVVVLGTVPDALLAKRMAHVLVEESLVACAQVGAAMTSMYLWQGKLEGGEEVPLTLKTTAATLPALYRRYCDLHPYEVPEFLVLGAAAGSVPYLDWVRDSVAVPPAGPQAGRG